MLPIKSNVVDLVVVDPLVAQLDFLPAVVRLPLLKALGPATLQALRLEQCAPTCS